ncbi:chemotaxis-specific protein-glutamate methyltransferase CheB [Pontixanthobacter sp. CEM42]|uniref:chemotaxis-specific protein-glutamate methyltransferase CheB n=1 Tax=Pontixanthobacter sp. CEM42 TaxID=2792077 RepID=UPI001FD7875D|nr:chemotaxis-specific protein-glutamate methyltransferase CheB [Pontixanthobacter sp. CEM42]
MGSETTILTSGTKRRATSSVPTRVMVVDDSLTVRTALARTIAAEPDLEVVCKTSSAELALQELRKTPADVVLLDLEMPGMGGLHALPKILESHTGIQILVVSTLAEEGAEATLTALSMGAADTMPKPRSGGFGPAYCEALLSKIRALGQGNRTPLSNAAKVTAPTLRRIPRKAPEVLAIGASTGGIHSLCTLLENLPREFNLPILVTQHLPDSFMPVFARQLELAAVRKAWVAEDGMAIKPGQIYVAPGTGHLNVVRRSNGLACKITQQTMPSGCMPSVDPMFETLGKATEGHAIGIVLSGMGKDGATGAADLIDQGGTIFAQDQDSSAVWGMPRAVAERGLASVILPPPELATKIMATLGAAAWK